VLDAASRGPSFGRFQPLENWEQAQVLASQYGFTVRQGTGNTLIATVNGQEKTFSDYSDFERYIQSISPSSGTTSGSLSNSGGSQSNL
jgi:hypothetical protein